MIIVSSTVMNIFGFQRAVPQKTKKNAVNQMMYCQGETWCFASNTHDVSISGI